MNFACLLEATARRLPAKCALAGPHGSMTWAELDGRASRFAGWLTARGVASGDRIAISLPNGSPFVVAVLGGLKLGVTITPLNSQLTPEEVRQISADLAPACVVAGVDHDAEPVPTTVAPSAPAFILYTSGSTGRPKGVVLSHAALCVAIESWMGPVMGLTEGDAVLAVLPLSHSFGLNGALLAPLLAGATVILLERFTPEAVLDAIAAHRVTILPGVATMFRRVLETPAFARARLSSLRLALSGAAPCPWELAREWQERTGVRLLRGYGSTELFRPVSYLAADHTESPEAVGRAVPGVELKVVDGDGVALPRGAAGELWIRSPAAMDGYLDAPEATRAVLDDGWFRTGDLAVISAEGLVTIVGRKKELILRGGYSVSPPEVETALLAHPAVAEAAVIGCPHPELGEEIVAFVALRPGMPAEPERLLAHCRERLAAYKCPRRVRILDALPRSATGKILKGSLAEP